MSHVEVAAGVLPLRLRSVGGQARSRSEVPIRANLMLAIRVGVTRNERKAMIIPCGQGRLQSVVVGPVNVRHLVDEAQERELGEKRTAILFAVVASDFRR